MGFSPCGFIGGVFLHGLKPILHTELIIHHESPIASRFTNSPLHPHPLPAYNGAVVIQPRRPMTSELARINRCAVHTLRDCICYETRLLRDIAQN